MGSLDKYILRLYDHICIHFIDILGRSFPVSLRNQQQSKCARTDALTILKNHCLAGKIWLSSSLSPDLKTESSAVRTPVLHVCLFSLQIVVAFKCIFLCFVLDQSRMYSVWNVSPKIISLSHEQSFSTNNHSFTPNPNAINLLPSKCCFHISPFIVL